MATTPTKAELRQAWQLAAAVRQAFTAEETKVTAQRSARCCTRILTRRPTVVMSRHLRTIWEQWRRSSALVVPNSSTDDVTDLNESNQATN